MVSQASIACAVEPFPLEHIDFDALATAAAAVCAFAFQRSPEAGALPEFSYYGLAVEPVSRAQANELTSNPIETRHHPDLATGEAAGLPFKGGVFVYLPYGEPGGASEPQHVFWLVRELLILDHRSRRAFLSAVSTDSRAAVLDVAMWAQKLCEWREPELVPPSDAAADAHRWTIDVSYDDYCSGIRAVQDRIAAGDIAQAIFSLGLFRRTIATGGQVFDVLRRKNASPHVFLLRHGGTSLVGASPAMHMRKSAGMLIVETDAGTRPVGATEEESRAIERELLGSEKDLEEQRMIVDETIRDLAAIACGPIEIPVQLQVRRLGSVMHLFTVLQAHIAQSVQPLEAVLSCFPPAAVTGAPRRAAMTVIREVECVDRGPYGGVLGLIGFDGSVDTAIILRSAWLRDGLVSMRCGGGITHASSASEEYAECLNKARSIQACIDEAEQAAVPASAPPRA